MQTAGSGSQCGRGGLAGGAAPAVGWPLLIHLLGQDGVWEKVSPPVCRPQSPRRHRERCVSSRSPPQHPGGAAPPLEDRLCFLSQTLQTSTQTQTLAQGLEKTTVSAGVHSLPQESIPFLFHLGIAISFCPQDPLRSALVPPLGTSLRTGFCLWWGVEEVQSRSLLRPAHNNVASCLFLQSLHFSLGSPSRPWKFSRWGFCYCILSFHGRGERSRVRQTERRPEAPLELIYPFSQPWGQGPA